MSNKTVLSATELSFVIGGTQEGSHNPKTREGSDNPKGALADTNVSEGAVDSALGTL